MHTRLTPFHASAVLIQFLGFPRYSSRPRGGDLVYARVFVAESTFEGSNGLGIYIMRLVASAKGLLEDFKGASFSLSWPLLSS